MHGSTDYTPPAPAPPRRIRPLSVAISRSSGRSALLSGVVLVAVAAAGCRSPEPAPPPLEDLSDASRSEIFENEHRRLRDRIAALEEGGGSHQALARHYGRLGLLLHTHREPQADLAYRHALHHQPGSATWLYYRADLALEDGDHDAARRLLEQAADRVPEDPWIAAARGRTELEAGEIAAAERHFQAALALLGEQGAEPDAWIRVQLGRAALLRERPSDAIALLEPLLIETGDSPEVLQLLAQAYRLSGDETSSRLALQRAEGRSGQLPSRDPYRGALGASLLDPRRFAAAGDAAFSQGRWERAARAYRRAIALRPDSTLYRFAEVASLAEAGDLRAATAALEEWVGELEERGDGEPSAPRLALAQAVIAEKRGDLGEALAALDGLLARAATNAPLRTQRARLHLLRGDAAAARDDLEAIAAEHRDADHHRFAATVAVELEELNVACRHLLEARQQMIDATPVDVVLARLLALRPDDCRDTAAALDAVEIARRATEVRADGDSLQTVAMAHGAAGEWKRATAAQRRAWARLQQDGVSARELQAALDRDVDYREERLPVAPWTDEEWQRLRFVPGTPLTDDQDDEPVAAEPGGDEARSGARSRAEDDGQER